MSAVQVGTPVAIGIPPELIEAIGAEPRIIESATVDFSRGSTRIKVSVIPGAKHTLLGSVLAKYDLILAKRVDES